MVTTTKKELTEEMVERIMQGVLDAFEEYHRMAESMSKLAETDDDIEMPEGQMDENIILDLISERITDTVSEIVEDMVADGELNASTDS
jgi:hypothetical protein